MACWTIRYLFWATACACHACSSQVTIGLGPVDGGAGATGVAGAAGAPACQASVELQPVPLDLVVMIDKSLTMNQTTPTTGEVKWSAVTSALKQFSNDPASAGIGVAVGFFAIFDQPNHITCNASDYAALPVKMGTLNTHAAAIAAAVDGVEFETGADAAKTPMHVALQGAVAYARTWASQHLDHKVVVAFVTDGIPNACDGTFEDVVTAAAEGATGSPCIRTHIIAIRLDPSSAASANQLSNLNKAASAGLTGSAFVIDTTKTILLEDQFGSILATLRQSHAASCRFALPANVQEPFDIEQVIVRVNETPIPWRSINADCSTGDGYFYDDNTTPMSVSLCDSTCARVAASKSAPKFASGCRDVPANLRAVNTAQNGATDGGAPEPIAESAAQCWLDGQSCGASADCCSSSCCSGVCSATACND